MDLSKLTVNLKKDLFFKIFLPQYTKGVPEDKNSTLKIKKGKGSILFVDDEKEITYMGKKMLESLGYTVDIRTDGVEALEDIKNKPGKYDLLVTDQAMPNILGTDLVRKARAFQKNLKVIIITGYNESLPLNVKEDYGVSDVVLKPIILSEFSKLIGEVLELKDA